jgi:hypothetical protein
VSRHSFGAAQDALLQRCFAAEQLRCVAASPDGSLVAAGGASGRIYVWQAGSGRLLRSWPAHYRVRLTAALAWQQAAAVLLHHAAPVAMSNIVRQHGWSAHDAGGLRRHESLAGCRSHAVCCEMRSAALNIIAIVLWLIGF